MKFKDLEKRIKLLAESLIDEHATIEMYKEALSFDYNWLSPEQESDIRNHLEEDGAIWYETENFSKTDNTGTQYKLLINLKFGDYGWYSDTGKFYKNLNFSDRYSHKDRLSELL